jgi:catechol 2,3-dioxygenase
VLREADAPGMDFMAFKVLNDEVLERLHGELVAFGCEVEQIPAGELNGCGRRIRFLAPTGHAFELFAEKEQSGRYGIGNHNPEAWPRDLKGMKAQRFDHCLLYGDDLDGTYKLFHEVLGFDLCEQVVDPDGNRVAQFLTVLMKAHDVAFIKHPEKNRFHHASFFCGGDAFYPDHPPITWDADKLGKAIFYHDRQLNERFLTALT